MKSDIKDVLQQINTYEPVPWDMIPDLGLYMDQVLTYVEAHDNHTLWDKLELTNPTASEKEKKKRHKLASSIILTSQGIPFIHAGQEFMRTKYGDHNSYKSPDEINQIDWRRNAEFVDEVKYMSGLIELRKKHSVFRMTDARTIRESIRFMSTPANTIVYNIDGKKKGKQKCFLQGSERRSSLDPYNCSIIAKNDENMNDIRTFQKKTE